VREVPPFARRRPIASWLVAGALLLAAAWPAAADTPVAHWGAVGAHRLVDTQKRPGAACRYDAVDRRLRRVVARPPVVLARDRTSGEDRQLVGIRAVLQRGVPGAGWVTVAITDEVRRTATDAASPFTAWASFPAPGSGRFRVRWRMAWFGADGRRAGAAVHEVDRYGLRLSPALGLGVRREWCPASQAGRPSIQVGHGPRRSGRVALTFDMGGRLTPAVSIMDWLVEHDVPATIFPTGATGSTTDVGRRVLGIVAAHAGLFDLGNHSWDHPRFTDLTGDEIRSQLRRTEAAVAPLAQETTRPWFRPPYGVTDDGVRTAVGAAGWAVTVRWDVTAADYLPPDHGGPTTQELVSAIVSGARGGSIVLLHLGGYRTRSALPAIVDGIRAKGLTLVTLGTLLGTG
jgi:peptidoglycan/xylan/chitin deacetylase (PgdA/CDA1 family)